MKRALVTGASSGVGAAICRTLASSGMHVIAHAHRSPDAASALVDEIVASGGSAETVLFDVTDAEFITAIITEYGIATPPFGESLIKILAKKQGDESK